MFFITFNVPLNYRYENQDQYKKSTRIEVHAI